MTRIALCLPFAVVVVTSCVSRAREVLAPEPEGGGTLSCREIVEQCDSQCSDPLCLHQCTPQGTEEARGQHGALLDCGQRNGCTAQDCMEQSCAAEIEACMGPSEPPAETPAETPAAPVDVPADTSPQQESP